MIGDIDAFLFNLTRSRQFPSKRSGRDIWCSQGCGPNFGGHYPELGAWEPFNGDKKCRSRENERGYGIPIEGGVNQLTNKKDKGFTISELEVWEITGYILEDQFVLYEKDESNRIREVKLNPIDTLKKLEQQLEI